MPIMKEPSYHCIRCVKLKTWGKYSCKKCHHYYTSAFRDKNKIQEKQRAREKRALRANSAPELAEAYRWLRTNVFPKGYIVPERCVLLRWQRKNSYISYCYKAGKEISIAPAPIYKEDKMSLYKIMLHEMLHLRMPHHRKSFKNKEQLLLQVLADKAKTIPLDA